MSLKHRWYVRCLTGLTLCLFGLSGLSGCQTYFGGMTLPSPHYLKHYPQYFTPDPAFPLQRERDSMIDPEGAIRGGGPALPAIPGEVPRNGGLQQPQAVPGPGFLPGR